MASSSVASIIELMRTIARNRVIDVETRAQAEVYIAHFEGRNVFDELFGMVFGTGGKRAFTP